MDILFKLPKSNLLFKEYVSDFDAFLFSFLYLSLLLKEDKDWKYNGLTHNISQPNFLVSLILEKTMLLKQKTTIKVV